jgi:hypothetical protein
MRGNNMEIGGAYQTYVKPTLPAPSQDQLDQQISPAFLVAMNEGLQR